MKEKFLRVLTSVKLFITSKFSREKGTSGENDFAAPMAKKSRKERIVNFFKTFPGRLKPEWKLRWVITFVLWLVLLGYLGFGTYFGIKVYRDHADSSRVITAANIFPYPAAFVNGDIIWAKEYYQQLSYIRQYDLKTNKPYSEPEVRKQIMDQLVENRTIEWQAAKNGIKVTAKDVDDAYQKIVSEKGDAEVKKVLNELYGMSEAQFKALIKIEVLKEKVQNELIAQVKLAHIVVKDEARANQVANKAKSGEAFDQLAKTYSEDVKTRDQGGELGFIARGNLVIDNQNVPEFEAAAFAAKVGEIYGPVKSAVGFQIGKVEDKKGKINQSYNDYISEAEKSAKVIRFIK